MRVLLYSGILYLIGVAVILALKPTFMFSEDGGWKEFGIGRDPERFTWFPFWLFTIVWALVSFFVVQTLGILGFLPGIEWTAIETPQMNNAKKTSRNRANTGELKPGYYMLNTEGTASEGVPKYIYIGAAPNE